MRSYCSHPLMMLTLEANTATGGHRANYRWTYKRIRRNKSQLVIGRLWNKTHVLNVFVIPCCSSLIATVTCVVIIFQYQQPSDYSFWLSVLFSVTSALRLRLDAPPPPPPRRFASASTTPPRFLSIKSTYNCRTWISTYVLYTMTSICVHSISLL